LDDKAQKINEIYTKANLDIKGVLIGPEGDFSKKEMNMINDNKFITSVSLGNNVLKSETACIVAASLIKEYSNHAE
jgi:16S rRNA (uracil1498-N3)-methyltransferase